MIIIRTLPFFFAKSSFLSCSDHEFFELPNFTLGTKMSLFRLTFAPAGFTMFFHEYIVSYGP